MTFSAVPETTLAWLAALVDGEGSVMLSRRHPSPNRHHHYRASVVVYNTDLRLIEAIVERTGVNRVYTHKRQARENHKRTAYSWRLVANDIRQWGPLLLPWLVCKREQMVLLLEALALADRNTPRAGQSWQQQSNERRDEIVAEISRLNRKGREPAPDSEEVV